MENVIDNEIFVSGFDKKRADIEDLYQFFQNKYGQIEDV